MCCDGGWLEHLEERKLLSGALPHAGAAGMVYDAAGYCTWRITTRRRRTLSTRTRGADGRGRRQRPWTAGSGGEAVVAGAGFARAPGVAYYDAAEKDLKYARLSGNKWAVATVDGQSGAWGAIPSLAFDSADHPMISYYAAGRRICSWRRSAGDAGRCRRSTRRAAWVSSAAWRSTPPMGRGRSHMNRRRRGRSNTRRATSGHFRSA